MYACATQICDTNQNGKDDFGEVFQTNPGGDPTYVTACPDSPRLIIIPIVSYTNVPVKKVTIRGWSLAYLSGYTCVGVRRLAAAARATGRSRSRSSTRPIPSPPASSAPTTRTLA